MDSQRAWLIEIAEKVDELGRMCADSITVVLTGGETITYTNGDTCINVAGEDTLWFQPEPH